MKKTTYFPHDIGAVNDGKIIKLRSAFNNAYGYGIYWMLIERMHESRDGCIESSAYAELKLSLGLAESEIEAIVKFCLKIGLFTISDDNKITTFRVQEHKAYRDERSRSGKKGVESREKNKETSSASSSAYVQHDAIKEKKRKEKKDIRQSFLYLQDSLFSETFQHFVDMRQKSKKPLTERAKELILITLHKQKIETANLMLEQSIRKGWLDVFPIKETYTTSSGLPQRL